MLLNSLNLLLNIDKISMSNLKCIKFTKSSTTSPKKSRPKDLEKSLNWSRISCHFKTHLTIHQAILMIVHDYDDDDDKLLKDDS